MNFGLTDQLDDLVDRFCAQTRREKQHTLRMIIDVFFADGFEEAERRLVAGLWAAQQQEAPSGRTRQQAQDRAEYLHTGKVTKKRRKEGAA